MDQQEGVWTGMNMKTVWAAVEVEGMTRVAAADKLMRKKYYNDVDVAAVVAGLEVECFATEVGTAVEVT